jgi:hypothetical protein
LAKIAESGTKGIFVGTKYVCNVIARQTSNGVAGAAVCGSAAPKGFVHGMWCIADSLFETLLHRIYQVASAATTMFPGRSVTITATTKLFSFAHTSTIILEF